MRICYLANAASVHTQRWATHFAKRRHDVRVVSFEATCIGSVAVTHVKPARLTRRLGLLLAFPAVRRIVKQIAPDILHAHYVTSYGVAGALCGRHPLVTTGWGTDVLVAPEESWICRQLVRFALSRADLITSMAPHMTEHLVRRGYAKAEKILTLPFGVDTELFNPRQRRRSHTDRDGVVVSTRRLDHGLNVGLFIRAIPSVARRCPNSRFVVAGDGPLRPSLEQLARALGVAERTEFRGTVSQRDMPALLGTADVFVSTSPSDGNNISLNEAMACGAFPVATDIAANRAWVRHGVNGILFPCGDVEALAQGIIQSLALPSWRTSAMAQNWEIVRTHASWQMRMAEMEGIYARLVH